MTENENARRAQRRVRLPAEMRNYRCVEEPLSATAAGARRSEQDTERETVMEADSESESAFRAEQR
jgi:hypothetical protein